MKKKDKKAKQAPKTPVEQPPPLKFGEAMVNITNYIGIKPDLKVVNKPTQKENGLRQFKDEKGVFYETKSKLRKGRTIVAE